MLSYLFHHVCVKIIRLKVEFINGLRTDDEIYKYVVRNCYNMFQ